MIVSPSGEIVTNNHVVQGADTVRVTIAGHGSHDATVVGTDPSADVAVLRVSGLSDLPTVRFANSSSIAVGDPVVAIGNALGLGGSPTVTEGIISATGRTITAADETGSAEETLHGLLQTDAPIVPGNSGGPLVDAKGAVVGMDTAAASSGTDSASVGFAIPANTVRQVATEIARSRGTAWPRLWAPRLLGRRGRRQLRGRYRDHVSWSLRQSLRLRLRIRPGRDDSERRSGRGRCRGRPEQRGGERGDPKRRRDHRRRRTAHAVDERALQPDRRPQPRPESLGDPQHPERHGDGVGPPRRGSDRLVVAGSGRTGVDAPVRPQSAPVKFPISESAVFARKK